MKHKIKKMFVVVFLLVSIGSISFSFLSIKVIDKYNKLTQAVPWKTISNDYAQKPSSRSTEADKLWYVASYLNRNAKKFYDEMEKVTGSSDMALRGVFLKTARTLHENLKTSYQGGTLIHASLKGTFNYNSRYSGGTQFHNPGLKFDCSGYLSTVLYIIGYKSNSSIQSDWVSVPHSKKGFRTDLGEENVYWNKNLFKQDIKFESLEPGDIIQWYAGHIVIINGVKKINGNTVEITSILHSYNGIAFTPQTGINGVQETIYPFTSDNSPCTIPFYCKGRGKFHYLLARGLLRFGRIVHSDYGPFKFEIIKYRNKCRELYSKNKTKLKNCLGE